MSGRDGLREALIARADSREREAKALDGVSPGFAGHLRRDAAELRALLVEHPDAPAEDELAWECRTCLALKGSECICPTPAEVDVGGVAEVLRPIVAEIVPCQMTDPDSHGISWGIEDTTMTDRWTAHLAAALAPLIAQREREAAARAWDEGEWAGREHQKRLMLYVHPTNISAHPPESFVNPYLAEREADR